MPDERHGTGGGPQEKGLLYWMVVLNPSKTGGSLLGLAEHESRALWRELRKSSRRHFFGTPEMKSQLDAILDLLHGRGTPLKKTAVQNRIVAFLLELLTARERASAEQGAERFAHVISHIESNLNEPDKLTIDVLSAIAGLSPSRFKALFKEKLGIPPAEYALRLRIEEARRRLAAGNATVTGVALDLGFSSSQYFASSFKRLTRMTPREAMKKSRQKR
jgi:AraC-like DNA-binding protein